jgi:VIT1/CCC1 family predicted Fe2+/Mn2+ transporter
MADKKIDFADKKIQRTIYRAQQMEITEYVLYQKLSRMVKEQANRDVLSLIAEEELGYYERWKGVTGYDVPPNTTEISVYYWMARFFGIIFMMKLRDFFIKRAYASLADIIPEATRIVEQDISSIAVFRSAMDEERLHYMGALVLGLNDAIIEITGAIAGFTFALRSTTVIALAGLITGVAGALSMASSEYLEKQSESNAPNPVNAAAYTGGSYLITSIILVAPYLLLTNYLISLVVMLLLAFVIIFFFSFYSTFLFDQKFRSRFPQMLLMSFGVAFVSFLIGSALRIVLHVNM